MTTEGRRCDTISMTIQVINAHTGGPLPRATVNIKTKRVSRAQNIPALKATHTTDANGEVTEIGTLYGTYSFKVHMLNGSDIFRAGVDRTIDNATCMNDACTKCSLSLKLLAEKEEEEITVKPCTCKGRVTIVNENTQQPIGGACVSYTVDDPTVIGNDDSTNAETDATTDAATDASTDAVSDAQDTSRVIQTDAATDSATVAQTDGATGPAPFLPGVLESYNGPPISRSIIRKPSDRAESNCKDDWCKFEATGSLFRYFESPKTWQDAQETCHTYGAHLASIPSMNVNKFMSAKLPKPDDGGYWIGGTQIDGIWVWGDASPWNYANWAEGEPNSNNENCVELGTDGSFNDVNCDVRRRFVCKKKGKIFTILIIIKK